MSLLIFAVYAMAKDYTQVNFRMPTKLKEQIEKSASNNERSITAELVARLEQSLVLYPEDHPINMDPEELLHRTTQTVAKEVIDEFVKRVQQGEFKEIKIIANDIKKAP